MAHKNIKPKTEEEFEQRIIDIARVTRVMAGGKRMRFRACLAIGDKKGRVGIGVAKGQDVTLAISKAFTKAKKNVITVPRVNYTIPHEVRVKFKAAKVLLKPASQGSGIKAGGAVRILLELAGISNITGKILGSNNKVNNVKATMIALDRLAKVSDEKKTKGTKGQDVGEKKSATDTKVKTEKPQEKKTSPAKPVKKKNDSK